MEAEDYVHKLKELTVEFDGADGIAFWVFKSDDEEEPVGKITFDEVPAFGAFLAWISPGPYRLALDGPEDTILRGTPEEILTAETLREGWSFRDEPPFTEEVPDNG